MFFSFRAERLWIQKSTIHLEPSHGCVYMQESSKRFLLLNVQIHIANTLIKLGTISFSHNTDLWSSSSVFSACFEGMSAEVPRPYPRILQWFGFHTDLEQQTSTRTFPKIPNTACHPMTELLHQQPH